jgi:superfamily II DNA helicase RecQ
MDENEEILRLLDKDPECQVVIATIAIANGLNVKSLLDSIWLGFPDTVDQLWQEKGRVGRNRETSARVVVLFQPTALAAAEKQIAGEYIFRFYDSKFHCMPQAPLPPLPRQHLPPPPRNRS